jgi:hypothetical protein
MQKLRLLFLGLLACMLPLQSFAKSAVPQMTYVEFRFLSPKIRPGTFEATTRKVWRSGDQYLRIEEAPDPKQHIYGVTIVSEPNVWMWNRFDNTAKHIVDHGPTFVTRFPVFAGEQSQHLQPLEVGREKEFFAANNAARLPDKVIDGVVCITQSLKLDDSTVTLYLRKLNESPFQISITNPRNAYAVRYEKYESHLRVDPPLFEAPRDSMITESK